MGAVHFSVDTDLISALKKVLPMTTFVETGSFEGDTIEQVLTHFESIHSVELSEDYYRKVQERFKTASNVHLHFGHSADVLRKLKPELVDRSVLYWLDAHWCVADKTGGGTSQCPLLEELGAIGKLGPQSTILIDDARLFLCPPPYPHEVDQWPSFEEVIEKLNALSSEHQIMVSNDVIIFYPRSVSTSVREYAYLHSIDWLQVLFKSKNYDAVKNEFDLSQRQLVEKDGEIHRLLAVAEERARVIQDLKNTAEERSRVIELINDELESIKQHWAYRAAQKMKRLLGAVGFIRK
jgi:hypothetical protein